MLADTLWLNFREVSGFSLWQWIGDGRPLVACFSAHGWMLEVFGSTQPVVEQPGWRHFCIERRLLALGGTPFRAAVMALRHAGTKTEPAFAQLLGLAGDPYDALLTLDDASDEDLAALIARAGL